jgi:hypothetical protein
MMDIYLLKINQSVGFEMTSERLWLSISYTIRSAMRGPMLMGSSYLLGSKNLTAALRRKPEASLGDANFTRIGRIAIPS